MNLKKTMEDQLTLRNYWEKILVEEGEGWITNHNTWCELWNDDTLDFCFTGAEFENKRKSSRQNPFRKYFYLKLCMDIEYRGFILLSEGEIFPDEVEIYFAFVIQKYRNQKIIKNLLWGVEHLYKGKTFVLEVTDASKDPETLKTIWTKLGFSFIRKNTDSYVFSKKLA